MINMKKSRVVISGIHKTKKDGTKIKVYFAPSNLLIQELNLDDKKRLEALNRKIKEEEKKKKINNKEIREINYPVCLSDVVTLPDAGKNYRAILSKNKKMQIQEITD